MATSESSLRFALIARRPCWTIPLLSQAPLACSSFSPPSRPPPDGERYVLDGVHPRGAAREHALLDREVLRQVLELDEVVDAGARAGAGAGVVVAHATSPSRPTLRAEPSSTFFSHHRWQASRWASGRGARSGGSFVAQGSNR